MEELIESYTLGELAKIENLDWRTIKRRKEYIAMKVINWQTKAQHNYWRTTKDYTIRYIRLSDVVKLFWKDIDFSFLRYK